MGFTPVLDAVRLVWASLWSDAAMLYRRELALDPGRSSMAVLLQPMRNEAVSGVAFGRDPIEPRADHALVEAVPGLCSRLVDGEVEPDRWKLKRFTGEVIDYQAGARENDEPNRPLLEDAHLVSLAKTLGNVESLLAWPPDVEWTGRGDQLTLLQARPITSPAAWSVRPV
jgi:pyruvate,water dikinase